MLGLFGELYKRLNITQRGIETVENRSRVRRRETEDKGRGKARFFCNDLEIF